VALKRLRQWARDGAAEELDLDGTIRATAEHGYLDVKTRPERRNAVKVILFLDVGGSMDPMSRWSKSCSPPPAPSSSTWNTTTSTTACMKASGATTAAGGRETIPTHEVLRTYGPTTNASSWAMPR
jgi:hypothetical protein